MEIAQSFPVALPFDFRVVIQHGLERTEALDQLRGALRADITALLASGSQGGSHLATGQRPGARDVVTAITGKGKPVYDL